MPINVSITDGLNKGLNKAQEISDKILKDSDKAWDGWKEGDPVPSIEVEKFDFTRHLVETVVNAYYTSVLSGVITVSNSGSGATMVCTWAGATPSSVYVDAIVGGMEGEGDFEDLVSIQVHLMVVGSGFLSAGTLVGDSGKLKKGIGDALSILPPAFPGVDSVPDADHAKLGVAFAMAFIDYCGSLTGIVPGFDLTVPGGLVVV